MDMFEFGYFLALALIAMIIGVRGYPVARHLRSVPRSDWLKAGLVARQGTESWSENELSVGRANGAAPTRYI
jgi:hypothetical protein